MTTEVLEKIGALERIRTSDPQICSLAQPVDFNTFFRKHGVFSGFTSQWPTVILQTEFGAGSATTKLGVALAVQV